MATFEQSTIATDTGATSLDIAFPSTVNAADDLLLFVVIDRDDATGTTVDNSFNRIAEQFYSFGSNSLYAAIFHKIASGSESGNAAISFGGVANDGVSAAMLRYSGGDGTLSASLPVSISAGQAETTPNAPGDVLADGDDFTVVVALGINSAADRFSATPTGYTIRTQEGDNGSGTGLNTADDEVTGDGSTTHGDGEWTITAAASSIAMSVAIQDVATATDTEAQTPGEGQSEGSVNLILEVPDVDLDTTGGGTSEGSLNAQLEVPSVSASTPASGGSSGSVAPILEVPTVEVNDTSGAGDSVANVNLLLEPPSTTAPVSGAGSSSGQVAPIMEVPDVDAPAEGAGGSSASASVIITGPDTTLNAPGAGGSAGSVNFVLETPSAEAPAFFITIDARVTTPYKPDVVLTNTFTPDVEPAN